MASSAPVSERPVVAARARRDLPRVRLVFILGALSTFGPLSIDMYLPALPALTVDFAASASEIQLTLSACLLGLALGQIFAGPLSDAVGRRRPLLIGVGAYALASLLCAFSPSIAVLVLLRFIQGAAGSAGIVIARAIVRDLHSGIAIARFFSLLMLVSGLAPILAPIIGGQLLRFMDWRGVFVALAIIGLLICLAAGFGLAETLPAENRQPGRLGVTLATFRNLLTDRSFIGFALASGLAFAAMFAYISGSPFVLQGIFGVTPQIFSVLFGINALGLMVVSQINGRLVGRVAPLRLLMIGLTAQSIGGIALLLAIAGGLGLAGVLPALFLVVSSLGFISPNATALALSGYPRAAGSASALLGVMQYVIGATAAPLVGAGGEMNALPMAIVIAVLTLSALLTFLLLGRRSTAVL